MCDVTAAVLFSVLGSGIEDDTVKFATTFAVRPVSTTTVMLKDAESPLASVASLHRGEPQPMSGRRVTACVLLGTPIS